MNRWWDPGSDVALLAGGAGPEVDLANTLVALHRAGAAAILDATAVHPVIDAAVLVAAMAQARTHFAPLLIEPVAKATGTDPNYAGLLLRDMFDDAEVAGLRLFQAAVARGVPRRTAAERVARVYGTPGDEMGRYAPLACDIRTPPQLLADVADETLFDAIANQVEAERDVPIAKAETRDQRRAAQADEPRARGRYTVTAEPEVQAPAEAEPAPAPVTPAARTRYARRARYAPPPPAQARAATARTAEARTATTRSAEARAAAVRALAARTNATADFDLVGHPAGRPRDVPDLLEPRDGAPYTQTIDAPLAFALPVGEFNALFRANKQPAGRDIVFRAGALAQYAGAPARIGPVPDVADTPHERNVAALATLVKDHAAKLGARPLHWKLLDVDEVDALTTGPESVQDARLKEAKADVIKAWARENNVPIAAVPIPAELPHVFLWRTANGGNALVYIPPPIHGHARPLPNVVEMYLPAGGVRGAHEAATRYGEETFTVDENQPLRRAIPRDEQGIRQPDEVEFDPDLGVARTQVRLDAGTEDDVDAAARSRFGKAETREQRQAAQAAETRDDTGRYATQEYLRGLGLIGEETVQEVAPVAPAARTRYARRRASARAAAVNPAEARIATARPADARSADVRPLGVRSAARRLQDAAAVPRPHRGEVPFQPFEDYTLATANELTHKVGVKAVREQSLGRSQIEWLMNRIHRPSEQRSHEADILLRGDDDWSRLEASTPVRIIEPTRIETDADWVELERRLVHLIYDRGYEVVTLETHSSVENGRPVATIGIHVADKKLPVQHAVRWESGGVEDTSLTLVPEGEADGLSRETLHTLVEQLRRYDQDSAGHYVARDVVDVIVNPRVMLWRLQREGDEDERPRR